MKNVLKHSNGSQSLLANVDDDTNRIFINDAEIPSSLWVGSGTYTQSIDGVMISITKISDLSGNIMLQKVSDNHYQLVRKTETASIPFSHIGQIIESTTLDSLDKVQAIYGSNTMWIQHTGYILRGASSGVNADNASNDGGADSYKYTPEGTNEAITLTAAQSGVPAHSHGLNSHTHSVGAHSHGLNSHTHSVGAHSHGLNSHTHGVGSYGTNGAGAHSHALIFATEGGSRTSAQAAWYRGNIANSNVGTDASSVVGQGNHSHSITGTSGAASGSTANSTAFNTGAASGSTANSTAFNTGAASGSTANSTAANATASHNHTFTGKESTHNNLPKYKNVYIWERTA